MKNEIDAILSGLPVKHVRQVGSLWDISLGCISGAREDGVSLAHDLKAQYEYRKAREAPVPRPADTYTAKPEPVEIPAFLSEPEPDHPPAGLADLIRENEPHGEARTRLMALYVNLQNKLMLGLASDAEGKMHTRLHGHLGWLAKGAAEVTI